MNSRTALRVGRALGRLPSVRGPGRVALWLYNAAVVRRRDLADVEGVDVDVTMRAGHHMQAPSTSLQSWQALATREYDDQVIQLLVSLVPPRALVLDVGASLGFWTVPLSRRLAETGGVLVAAEPVPRNVRYLRRNVELNGLVDTVHIWCVALGEQPGRLEMTVEAGGSGNAALHAGDRPVRGPAALDERTSVGVEVTTLDHFSSALPELGDRRCALVKLDVEGYELRVLAGARKFVTDHRPLVYGEFEQEYLEDRGEDVEALRAWLRDCHYRAFALEGRHAGLLTNRRSLHLRSEPLGTWPTGAWGLLLVPDEQPLEGLGLPAEVLTGR